MTVKETLEWYLAMGVDEVIQETPVHAMQAKAPVSPPQPHEEATMPVKQRMDIIAPSKTKPSPMIGPTEMIAKAKELADAATSLDALREAVMTFDGCALKKTANKTVFADGNPTASVMLVGEAPGADEDREGIPFCGMSGKLLDKALATIGLSRQENLYITNTLFWRPPGNRRPSDEELMMCAPFLEKHIALIKPKILILAGSTATTSLLKSQEGITKLRGKLHHYTNPYLAESIPALVVYHPSYLLRQPSQKASLWQDLLRLDAMIRANYDPTAFRSVA